MMNPEQPVCDEDCCMATQPVDDMGSDSDTSGENVISDAWAKLTCCSLTSNQNHYWLKADEFIVGRQSSCDFQFTPDNSKSTTYPLISKIHFIIEKHVVRKTCVAFIKDVSSNGTFVNDELIGINQKRVLSNEDVISVAKIGYRLFTFLYLQPRVEFVPKEVRVEYHVVNKISKGGFGDVYYVLNKKTCAPLAMKMITATANIHEQLDVFTELKILKSIQHKSIVAFYGTIMKDNKLFLLLEYMAGGDLAQLLTFKKRLTEAVARHIFYQVTDGLNYLHNQQIVHRDIKPLNILLNNNQEEYPMVKITDFGLSKKLKKIVSSVKEVVGTPAYRAPELRGRQNQICDTRVDVWSLGVLLYVCLCGKYPFDAEGRNIKTALKFDPLHIWYHISLFPKNIIKRSLELKFQDRPFCYEILRDDWFGKNLDNDRLEYPMKRLRTTSE